MKTKQSSFIILISIYFLTWLLSCSPAEAEPTSRNTGDKQSDLAALMRVMESHGDAVRLAIRDGKELPARPEGIADLLEANATEGMHINNETFPVFVKKYQASIEALYSASNTKKEEMYNAVIQSCSNCHASHCPGPLMKINKMFIAPTK